MSLKVISILKCVVAGIVIAIISEYTIGYTAAIAAPEGLFNWFAERDLLITILVLWDIFVVYIPGLGITTVLFTYIAVINSSMKWFNSGAIIVIGNLFYVYIASPLISSMKLYYFDLAYWQHSYEIALVSLVLMSGYVATRLNNARLPKINC